MIFFLIFQKKKIGSLFENHREEWLSSLALGKIHHPERRLSAAN